MKINRSVSSLIVAAGVALAASAMAGSAQARDVSWSVGLSSPGVNVGLSNGLPMYQPVYQESYPVYVAPPPVVYLRSAPAYRFAPRYIQADWRYAGNGRRWQHGQQRHEGERFGRDHQGHGRD
jgi:hypothetical protein